MNSPSFILLIIKLMSCDLKNVISKFGSLSQFKYDFNMSSLAYLTTDAVNFI